MDRVRKLEIISGIAARLDNELGQLKDWIRSELDASIDELGKSHEQDLEEPPASPTQLNDNIEINPQIVIETMDIKNEIEDQDEEQAKIDVENDEFILGGGGYRSSSRLRARSMSIDYSEYQSDFTKQEEQEQEEEDDEEYEETSSNVNATPTATSTSILNHISLSLPSSSQPTPFNYTRNRNRSRNRYNSFFNSNNENSPLKKLLSKLVHREKLPKIPKKPANFCSTCLLTFETHQLYKEHQQIHFKVPENHKFIESQRGNPLLEADGFYYRKTVGTPNAIYWQCRVIENGVKCYARATSSLDGERVRLTGEHKHEKKPRKAPSLRTIKRRLKFQGPASTSEYLGENLGDFYHQNHESTSSSSSTSNCQQHQKQHPATGASSYNPIKNIEVLIPRDDFVHQLYDGGSQKSSASTSNTVTTTNTTTLKKQISASVSTSSAKKSSTSTENETESPKSPKQGSIKDKLQQPQVISGKIFDDNDYENEKEKDSPPIISISDRIFNSNSQQSTNTSSTITTSTIPTTTTSNNTHFSSNINRYKEHHQNQMPVQSMSQSQSMPKPITNPSINVNSTPNSNRYFNYYDQYHQHQHHQSTNNLNLTMNRYFSTDQQGHFNANINRILNNDYQPNNTVQAHAQLMMNNAGNNSILDALNQQVNTYSIPPSIFDDFAKHQSQ